MRLRGFALNSFQSSTQNRLGFGETQQRPLRYLLRNITLWFDCLAPRILHSNGNQLMMSLVWTCQPLSAGIFNHTLLADARFSPAILWTLLGLWTIALILFRIQSATLFAVGLIATLAIVHHDFWNWGVTERSMAGLPQGFVFHVGLSIVAAFLWWVVTLTALSLIHI